MHRSTGRHPGRSPQLPPHLQNTLRASKTNRAMFSDQRKHTFPVTWALILLALLLAIVAVYTVVDDNMPRVESVSVVLPSMDRAFEGYTILHISDLHGKRFGPGQQQLATLLKQRSYSAVCITGDVLGPDGDPQPFYELLEILDPTRPVYFIAGDSDPEPIISEPHYSNDVFAEFITGAQNRRAIYVDAPKRITVGNRSIWIVPDTQLSLDLAAAEQSYRNQLQRDQEGGNAHLAGVKARERVLQYQLRVLEEVHEARAEMQPGDLHIALAHHPLEADFLRTVQNWNAPDGLDSYARTLDLVLAGHYNGGQARLPLIGPVYVPDATLPGRGWFPGDAAVHGLTQIGGVTQFISAGLGVSDAYPVPLRLFNGPRVALIRLTASLVAR